MAPLPRGYVVRDAVRGDAPAVRAATEGVYGGADYVPAAFEGGWLDEGITLAVATAEDGALVAVEHAEVIDGGRTAWLSGLRVHPAHTGRGLARALQAAVAERARALPGVRRLRYTTSEKQPASIKLARELGMQEVYSMQMLFFEPDGAAAAQLAECARRAGPAAADVRPCSAAEFAGSAALGGQVTVDWKVYDASEECVARHEAAGLALFACGGDGDGDGDGVGPPASVSHKSSRPTADRSADIAVVTVYARDLAHLCRHTAFHAARAASSGDALMLFFAGHLVEEARAAGFFEPLSASATSLRARRLILFEVEV